MSKSGGFILSNTDSYKIQIITKYLTGKLYKNQASELLNVSERTISRYAKKMREKGPFGIRHGNCGKAVNRKWSQEFVQEIINLKINTYYDFNTSHFVDLLKKEHKIDVPYQTVWGWLKEKDLIKQPHRRRRRKKHVYRPRMPQEGLLLQMDGSHHKFNGKDNWVLISCIDDATSEVPYAEFFKAETTLGCMKVLKEIIKLKGVPKAIYTDKAGWSGGQKRTEFSQFQRACEKLGIQLIYANSPEAKGRIERSFRTIQDRLIPELRHKKIKSMKAANKYLKEEFLDNYWNKENTIPPLNSDSAYEPLDPYKNLDNILVIEETRVISSDQTIMIDNKRYLVERAGMSLAHYQAVIRTNLDGHQKVFVMESEVRLTPVEDLPTQLKPTKRRSRFKSLDENEDKEMIQIIEAFKDNNSYIPYCNIAWTIDELCSAVRNVQVYGGDLKLKRPRKKVAA